MAGEADGGGGLQIAPGVAFEEPAVVALGVPGVGVDGGEPLAVGAPVEPEGTREGGEGMLRGIAEG